MYHPGGTIEAAINQISKNNFVLPAIQREFVWGPEQIERLFDSLMQGYPFGAFLFWKVEPDTAKKFQFYDFVKDYHQNTGAHCPKLETTKGLPITAVLDGQQRLTALNIGLRGSMSRKIKGKHWKNPEAYPKKYLYLDLLNDAGDDENGKIFRFKFLDDTAAKKNEGELWFKVGDIISQFEEQEYISEFVENYDLEEKIDRIRVTRVLNRLFAVIRKDQTVAYYEETSQELNRVLNIFIRLNSGGTVLSYSDLLLSIAVAQWTELDAREEIHSLVDTLNEIGAGFNFSHDFVLKAGLMLSDIASVGFKVDNFTNKNMAILERNWPKIRAALTRSVQLISSYGFYGSNLRAESALLPIAYFLYKIDSPDGFENKSKYQKDREAIKDWLFRSLLKPSGIWGSGLDTLLTALRDVLQKNDANHFPATKLAKVMAKRGKSLSFNEDEIEELLDMRYGDKRAFLLLSLLFPFVDLNNQFHVDHIYPISRFTKKKLEAKGLDEEKAEELRDWANSIANLQLLEGQLNKEKNAAKPLSWLKKHKPDITTRKDYCDRHALGELPDNIRSFLPFAEKRWEILNEKLSKILSEG